MSYGSKTNQQRRRARVRAAQTRPTVEVLTPTRHIAAADSFPVTRDKNARRLLVDGNGNFHADRWLAVENLRKISRYHEHATSTYSQLLTRWEAFLVGDGPVWTPATADPAWNRQAAIYLQDRLQAKAHDASGQHGWAEWVGLMARQIARDGAAPVEHFANGSAELMEAAQLVHVDTQGDQVVSWHIAPWSDHGTLAIASAQPIPARRLTVPRVKISGKQMFGVPIMWSSLGDHDDLAELWENETRAAGFASAPWLAVTEDPTVTGPSSIPATAAARQLGASASAASGRPSGRSGGSSGWVKTAAGPYIMATPAGIKAEGWTVARPNLDVPAFNKQRLAICCNVLLPFPLAFDDTSSLTFSNMKAIQRVGNLLLGNFRRRYLEETLTRIAVRLLTVGAARGDIPWRADIGAGSWTWPRIDIGDRHRESQADAADLAMGKATLADIIGQGWSETLTQRAAEWAAAAKLVAKHNKKFPDSPITLHHIAGNPSSLAQIQATLLKDDAADQSRIKGSP